MIKTSSLQSAIRARIRTAKPTIQVYDLAPSKVSFPYITFGETVRLPNHTKDIRYTIHNVVLHIWDRSEGTVVIQDLMNDLINIFDNTRITVDDTNPAVYFLTSSILRDPDGVTTHGVLRFEIHD